jgi:hypothetical protein
VSVDEDDVANAALNSVIGRVRDGNDKGITDRDGFWRMLALVATRKAGRVVKLWHRRPRARAASSLGELGGFSASITGIAASREEYDLLVAAVRAHQPAGSEYARGEELAELVRMLRDGYDIPQIAERLKVARCTVYRWIQIIKKIGEKIGIAIQTGEHAP